MFFVGLYSFTFISAANINRLFYKILLFVNCLCKYCAFAALSTLFCFNYLWQKSESMLSQNKIKLIKSLDKKKYRQKHACFVIEGEKMVRELLQKKSFEVLEIFSTDEALAAEFSQVTLISEKELSRISFLKTPNKSLALVKIPQSIENISFNNLTLLLENIQDPGNLGTIIRTAAWFGVRDIFCSLDSVDVYNPKVVQSTMSALFTVKVYYKNPMDIISKAKEQNFSVIGTHLHGENIYNTPLLQNSLIIMGNESKGISPELENELDQKIRIPNYPEGTPRVESLNVGVACAITLGEFRRKQ